MSNELVGRDAVLARRGKLADAYVQAYGGTVRVVELSGKELDALDVFLAKLRREKGDEEFNRFLSAAYIVHCARDADRDRTFADEDVDAVAEMSGRDNRRLWVTIARLNGLADDAEGDPSPNP